LLAAGTDGRVLLVAERTEESVVSVGERTVNKVRLTLHASETLLMPVLVLETYVLPTNIPPPSASGATY